MTETGAPTADSILQMFVTTRDAAEADALLSDLISLYAVPTAAKIIRYKTRGRNENAESDAEDIHGEVMLQLVGRLQKLRADGVNARQIESFESYVAVATYNACDRFTSRKRPNRRRLKNGLRYLLTHRAGFNCWQDAQQNWVGGLARWQFENARDASKVFELRDDARAFARAVKPSAAWNDQKQAHELLQAIFTWANAPVDLDLLTGICAEWWNVTDETVALDQPKTDAGGAEQYGIQIADARPDVLTEMQRRVYLQKLWNEIIDLPPRQRAAVLLNLKDENNQGITDLWLIVGVTTVNDIAAALEMSAEQFAEIWHDLPLDDNRIAQLLNLTRQQVINLRKSARERLRRRMAEASKN